MGDVAKRLGISKDRLEGAIEDATIARIDAAVAAGDVTKEEGEALKEHVRSGHVPGILPGFAGPAHELRAVGPPGALGPGPFAGSDPLDAAADYLGIDETAIRRALRDGRSLADLAKDRGKSLAGLEDALRDEIRRAADRAADDGALTREQADLLAERLGSVMDRLVEGGLRNDFDFDFEGGEGKFEFHLGIAPKVSGVLRRCSA
ncbi:MAG: hypothetical protein ABWY97_06015 [Thermoleophilaceae bacterium]